MRRPYTEADDLMYHAAVMTYEHYDRVILISSDKDLLQAVNISNNVFVWDPTKKELRDAEWLEEHLGIPAQSYTHWRALQGDSSDNVAGVRGIGEKTATKLFQEFNSLIGIINAAHGENPKGSIDGKRGEAIRTFGSHRLTMNVYVMMLAFDRSGSRHALWQALKNYQELDLKYLRLYLLAKGFNSLHDPDYFSNLRNLKQPCITTELRMPVVVNYRRPIEDESSGA